MRIAIVTTHPIQYNAPFFTRLAEEPGIELKVFYTWSQTESESKYDPGFGKMVQWDIPLLKGYEYAFVKNVSPRPGSGNFRGIINPGLIQAILEWQPSALLIYGWSFSSHLQCIRAFSGKKLVIFRGDSTLLDEKPGIRKYIRRIFLRWVYSHIDYALYTGIHNKSYFQACGLKEKQLIYAPHAIDNARFAENAFEFESAARNWRSNLGLADTDIVLLFAGKFEIKKSPFFLLSIMEQFSDSRLKLLFVGNGPLEFHLKEAASKDERIIFMDFQNQSVMPLVYRIGDLFILPSKGPGETWGLALNEAMACSRAVAASSKVGGGPDLIQQDVNGVVFDSDHPEALNNVIKRALADKRILKDMGAASADIIKNFSISIQVRALMQILNNHSR